jgi:hypothetical protein
MRADRELPATFSEPEAQRILARAAELEVTNGTRFSIEDLRQIAIKAGIEPHALEHAINESRAVDELPSPVFPNGMKSRDIAMLALSGAAFGALAVVADNWQPLGSSPIPIFAPSGLFALYRALRHPVREGFSGLLRDLGIFFGSFTAAVTAIVGINDASVVLTWSLLAGAVACGILSLRGARPSSPVANATPVDTR